MIHIDINTDVIKANCDDDLTSKIIQYQGKRYCIRLEAMYWEILEAEAKSKGYKLNQIVHENFVGHDINLVKIEENADLDALEAWMNWATPTGLKTPSPEGVTFIGGTNESPAGSVQYFQVDLMPGNYAFIAEVPNASSKGMFKQFTVSD